MGAFEQWLNDLKDDEKTNLGSIYAIADRAGQLGHPIHPATVAKYLAGEGSKRPPEKTIRGLAAGFKTTEQEMRKHLKIPRGERGPWQPPEESARLNRGQRRALDNLIKTMVRPAEIVTMPLSDEMIDELYNEAPDRVAAALKVGEDKPTRGKRRTAGPGSRPKIPREAKHAPIPPDANEDAAL